jgi:hypothetical protein
MDIGIVSCWQSAGVPMCVYACVCSGEGDPIRRLMMSLRPHRNVVQVSHTRVTFSLCCVCEQLTHCALVFAQLLGVSATPNKPLCVVTGTCTRTVTVS